MRVVWVGHGVRHGGVEQPPAAAPVHDVGEDERVRVPAREQPLAQPAARARRARRRPRRQLRPAGTRGYLLAFINKLENVYVTKTIL